MGTLYRYELMKLLRRKPVWLAAAVCLPFLVYAAASGLMGNYFGGGDSLGECYRIFREEKKYRQELDGRLIDQALLEEMCAAYGKLADVARWEPPSGFRDRYMAYLVPYGEILELVMEWTGRDLKSLAYWEPDEGRLYAARRQMLEWHWERQRLTDAQKKFWLGKEAELSVPMRYVCHDSYYIRIALLPMAGICTLLMVSVCLSGGFAQERVRRTDQVTLACARGRTTVYWARLLAGITASLLWALLAAVSVLVSTRLIYGAGGASAPIQFIFPHYSYPMTMGQACAVLYGILILASVFEGVFVMLLSELTGSGTATLAGSVGIPLLLAFITMLYERTGYVPQLWLYMPMAVPWHEAVFDVRLAGMSGHFFASWQVIPAVHVLYTVLAAVAGRLAYARHQLRGRWTPWLQ